MSKQQKNNFMIYGAIGIVIFSLAFLLKVKYTPTDNLLDLNNLSVSVATAMAGDDIDPGRLGGGGCPHGSCDESLTCPNGGNVSCSLPNPPGYLLHHCDNYTTSAFCSDGSVRSTTEVKCWGTDCNGNSTSKTKICGC